jgi:tetratricopeptide (TPR) repeat protein
MLDVITTLDPQWLYPYLFGGVTLSLDLDRPNLANKLLRKGIQEHPDVWKLPFLVGFNAYFGLGDAKTAARFIDKASKLPGAPTYLKGFASRLYVKGGSRERALQFLKEVINQTEDPALRERLVERYQQIQSGVVKGPYEMTQEGETS